MSKNLELFNEPKNVQSSRPSAFQPLADQLRPTKWEHFQGVEKLDQNLLQRLQRGQGTVPSLILWGPPGSGKTSFAKLVGKTYDCNFVEFSAVLGSVKDVRRVVDQARRTNLQTVLLVDEIHRFNKAQQDAFLPHVERGTLAIIGATTENPSFYLNRALLSRARVLQFPSLTEEALGRILLHASEFLQLSFSPEASALICKHAGGDARQLLSFVEHLQQIGGEILAQTPIAAEGIRQLMQDGAFAYSRAGDEHYEMISAFIKSLRGSDPDAALFWGLRMLAAGEDPRFLIRRMIIFASEDVGNADPRAILLATATADAFERIGLPEGKIVISQCITYLACAPKSNKSYAAMLAAQGAVKEHKHAEVPLHLRNAPTDLMKDLGYGKDYIYPHDCEGGVAQGVSYLPAEAAGARFYFPVDRGYEKIIKQRLAKLKENKEY